MVSQQEKCFDNLVVIICYAYPVWGLWLWLKVHVYKFKKKKKRFPTDWPNLKILSPKGQHNNFFIWPNVPRYRGPHFISNMFKFLSVKNQIVVIFPKEYTVKAFMYGHRITNWLEPSIFSLWAYLIIREEHPEFNLPI